MLYRINVSSQHADMKVIIGIKHDFPFINIRKIPRDVLKTEGEALSFSTSPEGPCEC